MPIDQLRQLDPSWLEVLISTIALLVALWGIRAAGKSFRLTRKRQRALLRFTKAKAVDIGAFVGAYRGKANETYVSITADSEIRDALKASKDIILLGRPGAGKSHAALQNIRQLFPRWTILAPAKHMFHEAFEVKIPRRKYILLLDDVNEFVDSLEGGVNVLDVVQALRSQAKELIVVATLRSTNPEYALRGDTKIFGRWEPIVLPDWTREQAEALACVQGRDLSGWDGTPLSIKQPTREMLSRYETAPHETKCVLRAFKMLRHFGIKPVERELARVVYQSEIFPAVTQSFDAVLDTVEGLGFLKSSDLLIEVYDPYLDNVQDWSFSPGDSLHLREILFESSRVNELLAMGARFHADENFVEAEAVYRMCIRIAPESEQSHYRMGVVLALLHRWEEAAVEFRRAAKIQPTWPTPWYRLSHVLRQMGDNVAAVAATRRGQKAEKLSTHVESRHQLLITKGRFLTSLGYWHRAVEAYLEALEHEENFSIRLDLAHAYRKTGDWGEAERQIRKAAALRPADARPQYYLGRILHSLERYNEAANAHRASVELDPNSDKAYVGIALACTQLRDWEAAERASLRAIDLRPDSGYAHFAHAIVLLETGRDDAAGTSFRAAISHDVNLINTVFGLGLSYREQNRLKEAELIWRAGIAGAPEFAPSYSHLGGLLGDLKRWGESVALQEEALARGMNTPDSYFGLGFALRNTGDLKGAEAAFRSAVNVDPDFALAYSHLGGVLSHQHRWAESITAQRKALELGLITAETRYGLGYALYKAGKVRDAAIEFEAATVLNPSFVTAWSFLGRTYSDLRETSKAREAYLRALKIDASDSNALFGFARLVERTEPEIAISYYRKAIRTNPRFGLAYSRLGQTLAAVGSLEDAAIAFQKAVENDPTIAEAHLGLGMHYFRAGRRGMAEEAFRNAVRLNPRNALPHSWLGRTLLNRGAVSDAAVEYTAALDINPKLPHAHFGLGLCFRLMGDFDRARSQFRRALALKPGFSEAQTQLDQLVGC